MTKGIAPLQSGYALQEGLWLNSFAGGANRVFQNGITAKASGSATVFTQLLPYIYCYSVDTCATTGDAVALPAALPGTILAVINNTATSNLSVYAYQGVNNGAANNDTINNNSNSTANSLAAHTMTIFVCAKVGQWYAIKSA